MSDHPTTFRLDAHAAGDHDERVAAHLAGCAVCAGYVERLEKQVRAASESDGAKAAEFVLGLDDARRTRDREGRPKRPATRFVFAGASILAAAAALVLVTRGSLQIAGADAAVTEPAIRFKGKLQLAVIRDRRGEQIRSATEVRVRPGDRLRAEISVDDSRPVEVGFLGKDGTWVLLLAPALVEAGTYFSERAAQFDETPTEGWIVAGRPEAVAKARAERTLEDVSTVPVIVEP